MITADIENPEVLRRTLLEIESRLLNVITPISVITPTDSMDPEDLRNKLNEVVDAVNAISTILNSNRKHQF